MKIIHWSALVLAISALVGFATLGGRLTQPEGSVVTTDISYYPSECGQQRECREAWDNLPRSERALFLIGKAKQLVAEAKQMKNNVVQLLASPTVVDSPSTVELVEKRKQLLAEADRLLTKIEQKRAEAYRLFSEAGKLLAPPPPPAVAI